MSMMQGYIMAARVGARKPKGCDPWLVGLFIALGLLVALMTAAAA
jgi:hypothetical protein